MARDDLHVILSVTVARTDRVRLGQLAARADLSIATLIRRALNGYLTSLHHEPLVPISAPGRRQRMAVR